MSDIIIYTSKKCSYCSVLKQRFDKENISFIEKTNDEYPGDWYKVNFLTGIPMFPTIVIGNNILVAERDFQNVEHAVNIVDYITGSEYKDQPMELVLIEKIKTLNYTIKNGFRQIHEKINNLKEK